MGRLILVMGLMILSACAEKPLEASGSESDHPVYDYAGPHAKEAICERDNVTGAACDEAYFINFQQNLLLYYGGTDVLFHVCTDNPYICSDELRMENWFRNLRSFAADGWGWPCVRGGHSSGPEC